jgi:hypothetical protein
MKSEIARRELYDGHGEGMIELALGLGTVSHDGSGMNEKVISL